jgi:hypothetical protein
MALAVRGNAVGADRLEHELATRVMFRVSGMYGLGRTPIEIPISEHEFIDSGQIVTTLDPESDPSASVGVADFEAGTVRMRNGIQLVFVGLHDVVKSAKVDRPLLNPPRGLIVTDARINPDYSGWEAESCLDFLPGSLWSGAGGG